MIYLHHYEASPYAEKIRAMFGMSGYRWGSVLSPPYPPRPNLQPLVGEFRRIPVAHHGADVFCDTTLIARELAELTGRSSLDPAITDEAALALAQRAEGEVFFSAITAAPTLPLLGKLLLRNGLGGTLKFVKDRTVMMRESAMRVPQGKAAAAVLRGFLGALDTHLAEREWMDDREQGYADFCVYHPIWLALSVGGLKSLNGFDHVRRWHTEMAALGHGQRVETAPGDALAAVADATPRALPEDGPAHDAIGRHASIAPADYGQTGVSGTLVAVSEDRYILARETDSLGIVHLHFPRSGYQLAT